jgi:uroporphyrinogen-III synthase
MNVKLTSVDNSAEVGHHKIRVLATRPQQQAKPLLQQLQDRGYEAMAFPCLAIEPISADSAMAQQCSVRATEIDRYQHIIVVSANAAAFWLPWVNRYWIKLPITLHWWAIGEATGYRLQAFDIHAQRPHQGCDSEALLAGLLPQLKARDRVLIVRGVGGRDTLAAACRAHLAEVDYAECYIRQRTKPSKADIAQVASYNPLAVLCQSGETLINFNHIMPAQLWLKRHRILIVAPSQRVADLAYSLGFRRVKISVGASDQAMCNALDEYYYVSSHQVN